jgi:signal transduction histidine kinase
VRLRSHLIVLVGAAVLPLLLFAVAIVRQDLAERREIMDRGMQDTVRALSLAVDGEVKTSLAVLQTLAGAPFLDRGDLAHFHETCARTMRARPDAYVVLFDTTGKVLLNSSRPYGEALPNPLTATRPAGADPRYPDVALGGGDPVKRVLESGAPVVSDVFISLVTSGPRISLDVPVVRAGELRYVLEMSIDAAEFTRVLQAQRPPADTVLSLVDRRGIVVARTRDAPARVGKAIGPEFAQQISASEVGSGLGNSSKGVPVYRVHARSPLSGWTTSLGVAQSVAQAPLSATLTLLAGGAAVAIVLGLAAALVIGRRISAPISALAGAAGKLARGEHAEVNVRAVRELDELHAALVAAGAAARQVDEVQAASRAKDDFLAMLSHELRNPLAALTAAAHVLKIADPASEDASKAAAVVERQTRHMSRLISDLLDISRITHGKFALDRERLDLAEAVTRLVNVWRVWGRFERHNVALHTTPVWVDADRARIDQITANLLDNALKFTPPGKTVHLTVEPGPGAALLRVADEGVGLAPEARQRIFELFVQEGPAAEGGLGIGLALVKRLAEIHGGSAAVESAGPGKGALFTVRLPSVPGPAAAQLPDAAQRGAARTVLVVEDNDDARRMLVAALTLDGHEVHAAPDGESGLELAERSPPDVALIDIRLPGIDGYEVARRLRAANERRRIALIALTGFGQTEDRRRAFDAGFDAHLVKPVNAERLKRVIAELQ